MTQAHLQTEPSPSSSSAEPRLVLLDPARAWELPERALDWLEAALQGDPRATVTVTLADVEAERAQLWGILSGEELMAVVVTRILTFGSFCRALRIQLCGGEQLHSWKHLLPELEGHARNLQCHLVEIQGRRGWGRVFPEYRERSILLEKEL